jgi:hypothetical protein
MITERYGTGASRRGAGSGQPGMKASTRDSRVFTGRVDHVSISLMRDKGPGWRQLFSQPDLLVDDAPAAAFESQVTQLVNGADGSWCTSAALAQE